MRQYHETEKKEIQKLGKDVLGISGCKWKDRAGM